MRILSFFGWLFIGYIFALVLCFMLFMGCTQDGNSGATCADNTLYKVVIYPINVFVK